MFFKKDPRDAYLIRKLAMKNHMSSEKMLTIANKYALAEETTLNNKVIKKDKKPSHSNQLDTSKVNDKKRKPDRSVANVEQPRCNRTEYRPRPGEFKIFLDEICIFHP
jgi:hypothetical protein